MANQNLISDKICKILQHLLQRRGILYHFIGNAVDLGSAGWDSSAWIDQCGKLRTGLVVLDFYGRNFDDLIEIRPNAGCLQIEYNIVAYIFLQTLSSVL